MVTFERFSAGELSCFDPLIGAPDWRLRLRYCCGAKDLEAANAVSRQDCPINCIKRDRGKLCSAANNARSTSVLVEPRGLTRVAAACYCSLTPEGFDEWVKRGIVPGPIPGTQRWDRKAVDLALDRASGLESPQDEDDPFEQWRAAHARAP